VVRYYCFIGEGDKGETEGAILKRGYAFSHFAKFVRPGYQRIDVNHAESDLSITAYKGDGKIVLQIINATSSNNLSLKLTIPDIKLSNGIAYTTSLEKNREKTNINVTNTLPTMEISAKSITTMVFEYDNNISLDTASIQSSTALCNNAIFTVNSNVEAVTNDALYHQLTNAVIADTYARAGETSSINYENDEILAVKTDNENIDRNRKSLIKLDVSTFADAKQVLLRLVPEQVDHGGGTLIYEVVSDDSWSESTVTWDTIPAGTGDIIAEVAGYVKETAITIDITAAAKAEAAGDGVLSILISNPSARYVSFHSTNSNKMSNRPLVQYI